jgi:peptide/nickel transport system permease protein
MKRTWYFFRRNTLALIGLGILLAIVFVAIYAIFTPVPWNTMTVYCGTGFSPTNLPGPGNANGLCTGVTGEPIVCTYNGIASPGPGCYATPVGYQGFVAPTLSLTSFNAGPLPFGSLTTSGGAFASFFNMYQGLLRGADWTLFISVSIVAAGAAIGLLLGAIAGFAGGWVDEAIMRLVDIFLSIPQILFVIIVVAVISTDLTSASFNVSFIRVYLLIIAFVVVWWPFYTRIVRGQVLVVREQRFVEAAKASGAKKRRIIMRHIIPNSVYPVFVQMSLDVGTIPLILGALVYLGFQIFPSVTAGSFPEWGSISATAIDPTVLGTILFSCEGGTCIIPWWQLFFPGLALFTFSISVNLFSDGIRDALDPRLRR